MLCFSMICGWAGSKSNLGKAAGAEVAVERRNEKLHAAVARSTFWSQNVQNTSGADHFWKLRCGKIARRCSEKHILQSKCSKHCRLGPLFEVAMWKNCTPLWREAHLQVKMLKNWGCGTIFGTLDVQESHAAVARSTFASQIAQNTTCSDHFLKCGRRKIVENGTPLWRQAHLQVKMYKAPAFCTTFGGSTVRVH